MEARPNPRPTAIPKWDLRPYSPRSLKSDHPLMVLTLGDLDRLLITDLSYVRSRLDRIVEARLAGRLAKHEQEEFDLLCRVEHELMDAHQKRAT